MLLLIIAISAIALIYSQVLSDDGPAPTTIVKIVGRAEGEYIYLQHMGGEDIDVDNRITYNIGGESITTTIRKLFEEEGKLVDVWRVGEELRIPMRYDLDRLDDRLAEITGVDTLSNSIVFYGPVTLPQPVSDVSINLEVIHTPPIKGGDEVIVIITITSSGGNVEGAGDVTVHYEIPEGLDFNSSTSPSGHNANFDLVTGYWHVGNVKNEHPAQLVITLEVNETFTRRPTQLALLMDGSGSISSADWNLATLGLANTISNSSIFPHDGSVELTVIQFGGWTASRSWAQVELGGPKIITNSNYLTVKNNILSIGQLSGGTAMSCAFRLAADIVSGDANGKLAGTDFQGMASPNADWDRQVIILVTDGQPNIIYIDPERYKGSHTGFGSQEFILGKTNSEEARDYLFNLLNMNESIDEFNSLAVGIGGMYGGPDVNWLNSSIVWPNPYIWNISSPNSFSGSGWVSSIDAYEHFEFAMNEIFKAVFSLANTVNYVSSTTYDPNTSNHKATVTIS